MNTAEERGESRVRPYDFRQPERLNAAARDRIAVIHGHLARGMARALAAHLSMECAIEFARSAEERPGRILETPSDFVYSFPLASSEDRFVLFHLSGALGQGIIDRLLGGPGETREIDRPPTTIERSLIAPIAEGIRGSVVPTGASPKPVVYLDDDLRTSSSSASGVLATFDVSLGEGTGTLDLFYPYAAMKEVLGVDLSDKATAGDGGTERVSRDHIGGVRIALSARMAPTPVQIRDIASLAEGDVLYLDRKLSDEVEIRVGETIAFYGYPGTLDGRIGIQVTRRT